MPGLLRSRPGMSPFCHDGFYQNLCDLDDHQSYQSSAHLLRYFDAFRDHQAKYLPSFYEQMLHQARFTFASRFHKLAIARYRNYQMYGQRAYAHPHQSV